MIEITQGELRKVLDALDYAAEDFGYRADFAEKHSVEDDDEEAAELWKAADAFTALAESLQIRAVR